jgi:hypothetical protein
MPNNSLMKSAAATASCLATHLTGPSKSCSPLQSLARSATPSGTSHSLSPARSVALPCSGCSTTLLRYLHWRRRTRRGKTPSVFSFSTAAGKAGFWSTLMTRGTGFPGALRALRKKRSAAAVSRFAVSRKSIVYRWSPRHDRGTCPHLFTLYMSRQCGSFCWWASDVSGSVCSIRERRPGPSARYNLDLRPHRVRPKARQRAPPRLGTGDL